jgi:hypothetical protein
MGDDHRLYAQMGGIYNVDLGEVGRLSGKKLIPGIGGAFFLAIANDGNMQVYPSDSTTPIGPVGKFPGLDPDAHPMEGVWAKTPFVFDRHIVFDPSHNRIILIPPSHDQIIQKTFDLQALMKHSGISYLVVTSVPNTSIKSGERWNYTLQTLSNAKQITYTLEYGPSGMGLSEDGTLTWDVPAEFKGVKQVVVLIKNEEGETRYHRFDISIE